MREWEEKWKREGIQRGLRNPWRQVHHPDFADGFTNVQARQTAKNTFYEYMQLLYINYTSIKLLSKTWKNIFTDYAPYI